MAGPDRTDRAYIQGLKELQKLLKPPDDLIAEPWKRAMTGLAEAGERGAQSAAPVDQGLLKSKVYARVQKKPFPLWAAARSRGKSKANKKSVKYPKGYPYPRLLEYSPKHGHKGWFSQAVQRAWNQADSTLAQAGDEMQQIWKRGR